MSTSPRAAAARRTGRVNGVVLALLRSPARRLLSRRVCALRYVGPVSGATVTLPVQYATEPGRVLVLAGGAEHKRWWRAFSRPTRVQVLLDGAWRDGVGVVLPEPERAAALADYRAQVGHVPDDTRDPLVEITLAG
ncbi:hypothetical protein [Modestobacter roseus]|uniref:Deazaflavin-dependent oxidoreductase (Nitroreductase family) n=1 Tax=Modestobacter roseus TaxID=1181884 RepID=A0A562IRE9_9ACTN|nr:hypothetical protein [Modestobacter roseus]MQA32039.1 hypothetical protein [Modestobacter roseus]TWH73430.1 hypothetical protein JD78_01953 [Modestobacter roseus]